MNTSAKKQIIPELLVAVLWGDTDALDGQTVFPV